MASPAAGGPEVRDVSFLMVPDWKILGAPWKELLIAFYRTFSSAEGVSLVMPYDPSADDTEAIEQQLVQVAASAGLMLSEIADTILHPLSGSSESWRELASCVTAVISPAEELADWLVDLPAPLLIAPCQETLRSFASSRKPVARTSDPFSSLSAVQRDMLEAFVTLLMLEGAQT